MMSLRSLLTEYQGGAFLQQRDVLELAACILGVAKDELFFDWDRILSHQELDNIRGLVEQKKKGTPLSYLLGSVDFHACKIHVDPRVLIPRVETELLLDKVLHRISSDFSGVVYDLCCGSGCLGIAFKKHRKLASVYLGDVSSEALDVAAVNAKVNSVDVELVHSDLLDRFSDKPKADIVLCNPPYISLEEFESLEKPVRDFEPKIALTPGVTGLEVFKKMSYILPDFLNPGALVALEIGCLQRTGVFEIFSIYPWKVLGCEKDYAGLDRFIFLERE